MKRRLAVAIAAMLLALPAAAQQVYIDYDEAVDHSTYQSFDWSPTPETSLEGVDPWMHSQVKNAIEFYLSDGGLTQVDLGPELLVTYHTEVGKELILDVTEFGYEYGPTWRWDPRWKEASAISSGSSWTYSKGTLIIDIWDMANERLIWRGTAVGIVAEDPAEVEEQIDKALQMMVDRWREMRAAPSEDD